MSHVVTIHRDKYDLVVVGTYTPEQPSTCWSCPSDSAEFEPDAVYYDRKEFNGLPNILPILDDFDLWEHISQDVITLAQQKYD